MDLAGSTRILLSCGCHEGQERPTSSERRRHAILFDPARAAYIQMEDVHHTQPRSSHSPGRSPPLGHASRLQRTLISMTDSKDAALTPASRTAEPQVLANIPPTPGQRRMSRSL